MKDFIDEYGTRLYGAATTFFGTVAGLVTTGAFNKLLSEAAIGWLGILCTVSTAVLGAMTFSRGSKNAAVIKVAETVDKALMAAPPAEPVTASETAS